MVHLSIESIMPISSTRFFDTSTIKIGKGANVCTYIHFIGVTFVCTNLCHILCEQLPQFSRLKDKIAIKSPRTTIQML